MSAFEHERFEIFNSTQHPYKHSLNEFSYTNPALPGVTTLFGAMEWIFAVLYPNAKASVADVASLPPAGNTINDYRVVLDDGDGKAASYRWEQREGEASPSWHKVYDMDWGESSILSNFLNQTQEIYVVRNGRQDLDASGAVVVGTYAGQTIFGGVQAGENLTLNANSGDGVGADTGFVQVDSPFRPVLNNTYDLGTATEKWKDQYIAGVSYVSTMVITGGSITDSSGAISFDNENLSTTGTVSGASGSSFGTITLANGSITDSTGTLDFDNENLVTTGTITGTTGYLTSSLEIGPLVGNALILSPGSIDDESGALTFNALNLSTTGTLQAGDTTVSMLDVDNININGNTISATNTDGNIILLPDGLNGIVDVQKNMNTLNIGVTGFVNITSGYLAVDQLKLDAYSITSTDNFNIRLAPGLNGVIGVEANIIPTGTIDLGSAANAFQDIFLSGGIRDATDEIAIATILAFRSALVGINNGDMLFWDSVSSTFLPSAPDTEIDHGVISGLGDDDHTQYMLLAGRAGGQALVGGTAASENLSLESTADVTKGKVLTKDDFAPFTNASYSGGWSGTNLGGASNYFKDLYMRGEARNLRFENFTSGTLPGASAQNVGRTVWATDVNKAYVDTGTVFKVLGVSKFIEDTVWNGTDTSKDVTVSSDITDARNAIWALHDNTNDFDRIYCSLKAISATQVRITVSPALPAGSYRLIGIE